MHTSFTMLVKSGERYALVIQASLFSSFVVSLLIVCSSPFSWAYDAQGYQEGENCKVTCAQPLADTCGYMRAEVSHATAPHRDYITTFPSELSRVERDTDSGIHW